MSGTAPAGAELRVDPLACEGVGLCAHLAPGRIATDPWGFPLLAAGPVPAAEAPRVQAAVRACPHRALWLDERALGPR